MFWARSGVIPGVCNALTCRAFYTVLPLGPFQFSLGWWFLPGTNGSEVMLRVDSANFWLKPDLLTWVWWPVDDGWKWPSAGECIKVLVRMCSASSSAPRSTLVMELFLCLQVKPYAVTQDVALQAGFHSRAVKVFVVLLSLALKQLFVV